MEKAEFLAILAAGGQSAGSGSRTSWVNIKAELLKRTGPFTKNEVAEEFSAKTKYVYSHLREWVQEGDLVVINFGGSNVYMAATQVPEE